RKKMHQEILAEYLQPQGSFLDSLIPYNSEIEKMGIYRSPLVHYRPDSKVAKAYQTLWQEIKSRLVEEKHK
ncbi:MAG: ParA family protein, partial [Calditrichota bacterium]